MRDEDILAIALESGINPLFTPSKYTLTFARRIQAAERERCAGVLDKNAALCSPFGVTQDVLIANAAAIREQT